MIKKANKHKGLDPQLKLTERLQQIGENPIATSLLVFFLLSIVVIGLSLPYYLSNFKEFYQQVLAEAHGMLFDIAVIGILIFWLNYQGEKRRRIRTYLDEIDDFRLWNSEEAAYRTAGNIKRLNRHKIYDLNLAHCHIARTNLNDAILKRANLNLADFSHSMLIGSNFEESRLNQTSFKKAHLNQSILCNAYANGADFSAAFLINADLRNTSLIKANFENAILMEAQLNNCDLKEANFRNCNLFRADLRGALGLSTEQLREAKNLHMAKLDERIQVELKASYPELLEK